MKKTKKVSGKKSNKFVLLGLILLVVALIAVLVFAYIIPTMNNRARYQRIIGVYDSLNLGSGLIKEDDLIFGDKRPYPTDPGRSRSSAKNFVVPKNVDVTAAELDTKIKAAGFVFFDEPYKGSLQIQYHYKKDGVFVRLSVSGKPRDDAFFNIEWMKGDLAVTDSIDPNAGPSNVTIKVNLDDNNE